MKFIKNFKDWKIINLQTQKAYKNLSNLKKNYKLIQLKSSNFSTTNMNGKKS